MNNLPHNRTIYILFPFIAVLLTCSINVQLRFLIPICMLSLVLFVAYFSIATKLISHRIVPGLVFTISLLTFVTLIGAGILFQVNFSNFDHGDIACYASSFFNSSNGLPGVNAIWNQPILAMHSEFFLILAGWIFNLIPSPFTLIIIQAAGLFTAWFIIRRWLLRSVDQSIAELLSLALALSPIIAIPMLKGFHGISLGLPFMALTAVSFIEKKYKPFLISTILLLLVKETSFVSILALSVSAFVEKRTLRWWIAPLVLSVVYAVLLKFVYFPLIMTSDTYYYNYLIPGSSQIIAQILSWYSLRYLIAVTLFGTIFFYRSSLSIVALPMLAINVFLGNQFASLQFHYIIEPVFWIQCAAMAYIVKRNTNREKLLMSVSALTTVIILSTFWRHGLPLYVNHVHQVSYQTSLHKIPDNQRVVLAAPLSGHLWKCKKMSWAIYDSIKTSEYDYFLIQKINNPVWCTHNEFLRVKALSQKLNADSTVIILWEDPIMVVYKRVDW